MSDILAEIDDTLTDWRGSKDSMRWRPDGVVDEDVFAAPPPTRDAMERLRQQIIDAHQAAFPLQRKWRLVPEVWPHRDYVLDLHRVSLVPGMVVWVDGVDEAELLRVIEGPPFGPWRVRPLTGRPSRLDARYRQRQKNRRKRRR